MAKENELDLSAFDEEVEVIESPELDLSAFDEEEAPEVSKLESAARGAAQGLTFDFADELLAALKSSQGLSPRQEMTMPIEKVREASKAESEAYRAELEKQREAFKAAQEANPMTYMGADIGAGIIPAIFSGGATAAGKVGKEVLETGVKGLTGEGMKQAAKVGAGYGAAVGAGMSEAEGLPELAADVTTGAVGGAVLGGATPIAGKALKEVGKLAAKPVKALGEKLPSIKTGFQFGKKYGVASNEKINNLLEDNTRELIDVMNKSFQKLGLEKEAAMSRAKEMAKTYDVTEGIQDVADQFRKQAEALLPADQKLAQKMAEDIEEAFLKVDVQRQKLLDKVQIEIQKKMERSANLEKKAISKGEAAAVKEAEKSGATLEQLQDIKKRFEDVSELPYDTKGGRIAGQKAKFKDEYLDIDTGEMVPYEYSKKYLKETTPFQPSDIRVGEVDDKLAAQYIDEATGEVFTKMGPKSQFLEKDFSKLSLEELSDLTTQYGQKGFDEKDPVYKELYKVVRNKLEEAGMDIPENKKEMFNLFQTMGILGIDKTKLKYPSTEDVVQLAKKIPGKMDLEKSVIQRRLTGKDSDLAKKLDDLNLISDAKKYLGEGYTSATGEYTRAGFIQKGISSVSDVAGVAYGTVSRPVNKVVNKVSQMSDEGLQYVNKQMAESQNEGIRAMGRQLDSALQQEGPVKNALIWSLSQNPAFRKTIDVYLPKLDEGLKNDLKGLLPEDQAELFPEGGMSKEIVIPEDIGQSREPASFLEGDDLTAVRDALAKRESGGNPKVVNRLGYAGKYQFGAAAMEDLGYLKPGSYKKYKNRALKKPELYTGKSGVNNLDDFLNNEQIQDETMEEFMRMNYDRLKRSGVDVENMSPEEVAGLISASHLSGAKAAKKLIETGESDKDAFGTKTEEYYDLGKDAIERAKKAIDRQIKQQGSGNMTPESHIDNTLGTIEDLDIDEMSKEALQDEVVKMETFSDAERLKRLLDGLKSS